MKIYRKNFKPARSEPATLAAWLLVSGLLFLTSACCTKKGCLGFDKLNEIRMLNFSANEVDSIAFEIFPANSNFTSRIDSSFTRAHASAAGDNNQIIFMPEHVNKAHDYKITLLSTGQVYTLTNFETLKEECNCRYDKYDVLNTYSVNGQQVPGPVLSVSH